MGCDPEDVHVCTAEFKIEFVKYPANGSVDQMIKSVSAVQEHKLDELEEDNTNLLPDIFLTFVTGSDLSSFMSDSMLIFLKISSRFL